MRHGSIIGKDITALILPLRAIAPNLLMEEVADLFRDPEYADVLSLPVVFDDQPVGVISRYRFMDVYLKPYGRELYGKHAIRAFMNAAPLVVAHDQPLAEAAQHVTGKMQFPLTEDFIITRNGSYAGVGFVVDLLKAMELQMRAHADELDQAYCNSSLHRPRWCSRKKWHHWGRWWPASPMKSTPRWAMCRTM